ncbi:YozQ family protein [Pallidibacillus pasinlerensis]|uniref:DUF4025 domain-containing protein n=1 Tax=Pallidibacillus pasinlerensis TaxID=2703818 RepID=A0ABX0A1B0_9BACI|nr:YozQ family protein [Pallidibacillus pasinlerensis]NCU17210.1 DUF4025 domain-containing protein [Pallidibacillus pasinlerensis]
MSRFDSKKLAGLHYEPSMKANENKDEVQQGLDETYEQFLNNFMDGTVDNLIDKS